MCFSHQFNHYYYLYRKYQMTLYYSVLMVPLFHWGPGKPVIALDHNNFNVEIAHSLRTSIAPQYGCKLLLQQRE